MALVCADVGPTKRAAMTKERRRRAFERHDGICVLCETVIDPVRERWICEHVIPLAMGGADADENIGPAHEACALKKTKADIANIAKAKRIKDRHIGITRPKGTIKSRGFNNANPAHRATAPLSKPRPPRRPIYETRT